MNRITYCLITHTSYADVLHIYLHKNKRNIPWLPLTIAINDAKWLQEQYGNEFPFQKVITYDDSLLYGARMKYVLEQLDTEYVLINHDSNVIVEPVKESFLNQSIEHMDVFHVEQLRLFDGGILNPIYNEQPFHKLNHSEDYNFSAMTALWRRSSLLGLYTIFFNHTMRCIECEPIQNYARQFNSWYCSSPNDIIQRPVCHSICSHVPFVHVTHHGKWMTNAHGNQKYIHALANEFGINLSIRGCQ